MEKHVRANLNCKLFTIVKRMSLLSSNALLPKLSNFKT